MGCTDLMEKTYATVASCFGFELCERAIKVLLKILISDE